MIFVKQITRKSWVDRILTKTKYIHRRKLKKTTKRTIHKFTYVSMYKILHQGNGVFKCKSQGSHKWTRRLTILRMTHPSSSEGWTRSRGAIFGPIYFRGHPWGHCSVGKLVAEWPVTFKKGLKTGQFTTYLKNLWAADWRVHIIHMYLEWKNAHSILRKLRFSTATHDPFRSICLAKNE